MPKVKSNKRNATTKSSTKEDKKFPNDAAKLKVNATVSSVIDRKTITKANKMAKEELNKPLEVPSNYPSLGKGPPQHPKTGNKFMGCHVSAAGGVFNAFENAHICDAKSFGLFLRNQRSWHAKPLDEDMVQKWEEARGDFPLHLILPHGSYLMNLGSPKPDILTKSRALLIEELRRCQKLGIPNFNFHPGSTLGEISRDQCCTLIAESINMAHKETKGVVCVLENMSKQGFTIGGDFHELRCIIKKVEDKTRIGVCLDTCHAHAAGYDLSSSEGFDEFISDFEKIIGWQFLRGLHINDSKGCSGDHLDRHENIGKGKIGIKGFSRVMNCPHFVDIPLILETPYTSDEGYKREIHKLEKLIQ